MAFCGHACTRALAAMVCRQPASTSAENQFAPICGPHAQDALGAWKSVRVLIDHIAIEAGFSKHAFQAQCVVIDVGDEVCKFVHVKKQHPWFVAAVGGAVLKKGHIPIVHVVDVLTAKVHGKSYKDAIMKTVTAVAAKTENEEVLKDEENAETDPMDMLFECAPDPLETPKKNRSGNESRNAHPRRKAHWCGQSTCPSDRIALEVLQELAKLCTCSSDPIPKHCGLEWIALIG